MTSPDRQPQSRLTGRARDGGAPAPVVAAGVVAEQAHAVQAKATSKAFGPYMLPPISCSLVLSAGFNGGDANSK